jgi:hypothetical protein
MQTLQLQVKYTPHPKQLEFHQSKARFRILSCGRRWGKTVAGANEYIRMRTSSPPDTVGYCVAPTYSHSVKQWKEIKRYCPKELIMRENLSNHTMTLIGNRDIYFKSADSPDSMRGDAVYDAWWDEPAQVKEERFTLEFRPSIMDTHGPVIFTGTPAGKNWYFQLWTRGQDPAQRKDYESWAFSSYTNPYLDPKEIDEFKRDMPELAYRQEILAEFLDDVGSVFRNVNNCIQGTLEPPNYQKRYVAGCDLAKHEDFTVIYVLDQQGHLCFSDRFSQLDWIFQSQRIQATCKQYNNARLVIDSTGVGDPVFDYLKRLGVKVEGYKYNTASKADLIENLSQMIETRQITFPKLPELINELGMFGYKRRASGTYEYSAPDGYHDDCVNALALAAWQLKTAHNPSPGVFR